MNKDSSKFSGTMDVRERLKFDTKALEAYLPQHMDITPPLVVKQFKGGQSNPTYHLTDTTGRTFVLRRKPPGKILKGAHAIEREYKVMTALGQTDVPVPKTFVLCEDESIIGTAFFVMDCVEGRIFWNPALPEIDQAERHKYVFAMADALAALHNADYQKIGLGDYGKQGNYFERQIAVWSRQYLSDEEAGRLDEMDKLVEWLPKNIPNTDETSIVHGDFRLDNMIFHPTEPKVIAILDWELSTLGHPMADFAYSCLFYRMTPDHFAGFKGMDVTELGLPPEQDYIAHYAQLTGRETIPHMDYYTAFNMFRLAAIIHGIKGRMIRGNAASKEAEGHVARLEPLAKLAWQNALKVMEKAS